MKRSDRLLGILLMLRSGRSVTALQIAEKFEISVRTVYRDIDTLSALGVPVYAERGRGGGFRLLEGYFLPAISFNQDEAVSLLVSLTLVRSLRSRPFSAALDAAESKLLAAMPSGLRENLDQLERLVGFESTPVDVFHPERSSADDGSKPAARESHVLDVFFRSILDGSHVRLRYHSPYREPGDVVVVPAGMFWDRERWYLAGRPQGQRDTKIWRADRVLHATAFPAASARQDFDVRAILGRRWLAGAMRSWRQDAPVRLSITPQQAERLRGDWYYRHACFTSRGDGRVEMVFGEDNPETVLDLVRWLGPGAEILAPQDWRQRLVDQLQTMVAENEHPPGRQTV